MGRREPDPLHQIARHVRATREGASLRSSCGGEDLAIDPDHVETAPFVRRLSNFLYANHYAFDAGLWGAGDKLMLLGARLRDPGFLARLRGANPGIGYPSPGWKVTGREPGGGLFVHKDGLTLFAQVDRHLVPGDGNAAVGDTVTVLFPNEAAHAMSGFYFAFGDRGPAADGASTRFYLNLDPSHAPVAIHTVLSELLHTGIRYTLKTLTDPQAFARRDNTVLYVARDLYPVAAQAVLQARESTPQYYRHGVPSLTRALAPGVAVADDPSPGVEPAERLSFGQHRMGLLAQGLARALGRGEVSRIQLVENMRRSLVEAGLDPERPYLNEVNAPDYEDVNIDPPATLKRNLAL